MSMTLEEVIEQVERTYKENRSGWLYALKRGETKYAERCKESMDEFGQLAEWLKELAERRKQPEIIKCEKCKYFEIINYEDFVCNNPESKVYATDFEFGCILGKRRTDG